MKNFISHGDVNLHPVKDIPKELKEVKHTGSFILAYGEVTGHSHRIAVAEPQTMRILQDMNGNIYIELLKEAQIDHEEHGVLTVKPGWYFQVQERERDWFSQTNRKVID